MKLLPFLLGLPLAALLTQPPGPAPGLPAALRPALASIRAETYWITGETGETRTYRKTAEIKANPPDSARTARVRAAMQAGGVAYEPPAGLRVHRLGPDVALTSYELVQHTVFHGAPCAKRLRNTQVFQRTQDRWETVLVHQSVVPGAPRPWPGPRPDYAPLLGEYELFPGKTYRVSQDGDRLLWATNTGPFPLELVPEDAHTFVMNGREHYRVRFERDAQGAVTPVRIIEFSGVEYSARRVKAKP